MYYEKHICDNMFKTIFGGKEPIGVCKDMEEIGIRPHLWLQQTTSGNYIKSIANYVMVELDRKALVQVIKELKTPTNFGAKLPRYNMMGDLDG
jgi:hypothetical protein